jgi:hypothetical protein
VVPGLLVAFPLMAAGLALIRRQTLATPTAWLCMCTSVVFAVLVAATQYERGGSGEWGGRYFALGLPVVVPVLLLALLDAGRRLAPEARRIAGAALAVSMVALSCMGIGALRATHQRNARMNHAVIRATQLAPPEDGGRAVVVAADGALARHSWPVFDDVRLLRAGSDLSALARSLDKAGITRFVLLTRDAEGPPDGLTVLSRQDGGGGGRFWHVLVVSTR